MFGVQGLGLWVGGCYIKGNGTESCLSSQRARCFQPRVELQKCNEIDGVPSGFAYRTISLTGMPSTRRTRESQKSYFAVGFEVDYGARLRL